MSTTICQYQSFQTVFRGFTMRSLSIQKITEEEQELIAQQAAGLNISSVEKGSATAAKLKLTVDEVIEGFIGSLGPSQILHVLLVSLAWIFDSQSTLATIFSDAQPSSWRWKTGSLCDGDRSSAASVCGLPLGTWEWIGGKTSSTIAEWSLICDRKFLPAIPASTFFIGPLLGSAFYGRLADKRPGRKRAILLSCLLTFATSFLTSLTPNIWIYALLRFSNGFSRTGIGICCLVLSTEAVGLKWRGQVGQYGFFFFTAGFLSLPMIVYSTRTCWRTLYKILSLFPIVYSTVFLPFVSESPRWLLVKGRSKEALDVLKNFVRLNGKKLPSNLSLANPNKTGCDEDSAERSAAGADESLWRTKWAAQRMILVMVTGFGVGFVYYGIQLTVENLNFDLYLSVAFNGLMEIPAVIIGTILLSFTNKRFLFSQSAFLAGVSCLLCIFFSNNGGQNRTHGGSWAQLTIEAIGFMAASTAFDVLYIYSVELFPTNARNFAVSFLRQALMLGASVSPLLVVLGGLSPSLSFLIFGGFAILSGVLSLWLLEMKDAPLCETLKMQEEEEKQTRKLSGENQVFEIGNCWSDDNIENL